MQKNRVPEALITHQGHHLPSTGRRGAGDVLFTPYVLRLHGQHPLFRYEADQDLAVEDSPSALSLGFLLWGLKTMDWALWGSTT